MKQVLQKMLNQAIEHEFGRQFINKPGVVLSHPPTPEMGDYASNAALVLAKELKMSPKEVAEKIAATIDDLQLTLYQNTQNPISNLQIAGGFINFTLNAGEWGNEILAEIRNQRSEYGNTTAERAEKIMVEYLSPNTNKPLHVGHLRNGVIGTAVSNLLKSVGHEVIKVQIINDRGVAICKAMLAWMKWGNGQTPQDAGVKPDHFVGDWYVRFSKEAENNPGLQEEAQELLRKWEAGDVEARRVWEMMNGWIYEGWRPTIVSFSFDEDKKYYESEVFELGKKIIQEGLGKNIFYKGEEKAVLFNLPQEVFGKDQDGGQRKITLIRQDGTSVYVTQDLGLAVTRAEEYKINQLIYITGSEQRFHFEALFAVLKALGYEWAHKLHHLWYGMVYLPHGKMKSREGTVVDADDLISETKRLARQEIELRTHVIPAQAGIQSNNKLDSGQPVPGLVASGMTEAEIDRRSRIIALAAIKFYLLKHKPSTNIHYNPEESISFEGFTGPYCLYTYARAKSILRAKSEIRNPKSEIKTNIEDTNQDEYPDYSVLSSNEERVLIRQFEEFPEIVKRAAEEYNPALVATHVFETCQAFNTFYTKHQVLKAESEQTKNARLQLVSAAAQVIDNGLKLLGIETVEEM